MTQGKLLIVDDELSVRDSLAKWFAEEGYDVATAENANEALTRVAEQAFDVALVDIKMRGTDGIELQRRLHEIYPDMLVIIMTGYASVETAIAALKNGAYDYVNKPLDPDEIAHLVAKAMSHRRTQQENTRLKETVAEIAHPSAGRHPLRRAHRNAAGERTLWPREGRVYWRAVPQEGQVRDCRRRHRVPGRDRRHQPEDPDRPVARSAGARDHARGRQPGHQSRFSCRRRHQ